MSDKCVRRNSLICVEITRFRVEMLPADTLFRVCTCTIFKVSTRWIRRIPSSIFDFARRRGIKNFCGLKGTVL